MTEAKYSTHTYNLSIERVDTPVNLSGGSINVLAVKGDCFIKINDKSQDPINLLHTANIKTEFTKFYLSNNVQVGGYVTIVIGKHCEFELTTNIAQATHTSLLLPQQNIPEHLRDRAIGAPEVINVWNIENATLRYSFSIGTQGLAPSGLFFRPDGLKVYTIAQQHNNVNEYDLGRAWDISSIIFKHSFGVGIQSTAPVDLFFSSDGTVMYIIDTHSNLIYPYNLSTAWNVTTASYLSTPFNVTDQMLWSTCMFFNSTGHKMYIIGLNTPNLIEYDLGTAWDITTTVFKHSINLSPKITTPYGLFFSPDGLKFYIIEYCSFKQKIFGYRLLEAWNVTTAVYQQSFDYSSIVPTPYGLFFKSDGSKMYMLDISTVKIYEFDL